MLTKFFWGLRAVFFIFRFGEVGLPSYVGKPIFVLGAKRVKIGKKLRLFPGWRIEVFEKGTVVIEDNVGIAQNFHLTCGKSIRIGSGTRIAANVCVTDVRHRFLSGSESSAFDPSSDEYEATVIGKNCFIGFGSVIDHGTVLGDNCIVAANAYVRGTHQSYSKIGRRI